MVKKQESRIDFETDRLWDRTSIDLMIDSCLKSEIDGLSGANRDYVIETADLIKSDPHNLDYALSQILFLLDNNSFYQVEHYARLERNFMLLGIKKK